MDDPAYILTMDAILYFYQKKGITKPKVEPVGQKTYMLVRIGLDVEQDEWFGQKVGREESGAGEDVQPKEAGGRQRRFFLLGCLWDRCTARRERKKEEARRQAVKEAKRRLEEERQERLRLVGQSVRELSEEALSLVVGTRDCFLVYEDSLRRHLTTRESEVSEGEERGDEEAGGETDWPVRNLYRKELPILWKEGFPLPEFTRYTDPFWVELLAAEAVLPHFVVLGSAPCLFSLMERQAHRMKSLCFILMEKDLTQELLDFTEDFYEEYGLAVTLQLFSPCSRSPWRREGAEAMRRLGLKGVRANIFDFTEEPHIAVSEAAPGSIWLDMRSMEEKRRRIEAKGDHVSYHSLKTKWRRAQKRCNCPVLP